MTKKATQQALPLAGALVVSTDDLSESLANEAKDLDEALQLVKEFEIPPLGAHDHELQLAFAEESRALTKGQWSEYEAKRTSVTGPLNQVLKTVNGWFKPVQTTLKAMEYEWNRKLVEARAQAQLERQKLIEAAKAAEEPEIMRESLVAASEAVLTTSTVSFRDRYVFEVHDPEAVPREYLCPDEAKIGKVVAALKDKTSIPGVRVWNDPIVSGPSTKPG